MCTLLAGFSERVRAVNGGSNHVKRIGRRVPRRVNQAADSEHDWDRNPAGTTTNVLRTRPWGGISPRTPPKKYKLINTEAASRFEVYKRGAILKESRR